MGLPLTAIFFATDLPIVPGAPMEPPPERWPRWGIGACQVLLALLTLKRTGRALLACVVGVSTLLPAGLFFAWLTRLLGL